MTEAASNPAKSPRHSRFRRRRSNDGDAVNSPTHHRENLHSLDPPPDGEVGSPRTKKASRFRRENGITKPQNLASPKKGLFARQREKRAQKKRKGRRRRKESGIKSDGDSFSEDGDFVGVHDLRDLNDCTSGIPSSKKRDYGKLAKIRRQQSQEQQEALDLQMRASLDDSSVGCSNPSLSNSASVQSEIGNLQSFDLCAKPPVLRKKVSFGEQASAVEEKQIDSQDVLAVASPSTITVPKGVDDSELDTMGTQYNAFDFPDVVVKEPSQDFARPPERRTHRGERARYSVYHGGSSVKKRFKVRPYHCFPDGPVSMTEEEIYADSLKPSKEFEQLKSYLAPTSQSTKKVDVPDNVREMYGAPDMDGRIGALRVEVLGCVSLNRTKPDVSVYLVCGDAAFCTDVLNGYRSPMWPSVSRRACVFPLHHAYAKLYVGIFDVRKRKNKENDVFCGRVAIDIASIRPDTEYDTTMPLRASAFVYDKRKRGVIRLRFSLHWFHERAAVISYFKSVRSLVDSCPLVEGQPAIPCADPKTFRNVAVTVYGQDLPGVYSRNAFRATMREFNLYQQNLRMVVKFLVLDAMLYEKPWMSLYLFGAAMYCILLNSVRMVPAFFVGYILILYIENYLRFVEDKDFHLGYKPLTIIEVLQALILNGHPQSGKPEMFFQPANVQKLIRRRHGRPSPRLRRLGSNEDIDASGLDEENDGEIKPLDHREFPFSERDAYPRFLVEDALAPGSSKGDTGRLHGRLSVYYIPEAKPESGSGADDDDDDDSMQDSDRDDETVMTESQMIGDSMFDLDDAEEEDEDGITGGMDSDYKRALAFQSGEDSTRRRIRVGPPQDCDVLGRKVPPQLTLKRVENMLNKFSGNVSLELVHAPPRALSASRSDSLDNAASNSTTGMTAPSAALQAKIDKKAKKLAYDDFDKLLGLQSRNANPIHRIMSSFMGPIMRMIRVGVFLVRLSFNVTTWRDPFLSFWVLVMLCLLCLILIVFPWRSFFTLMSVVCLGPQNILVRKYFERKAADADRRAMDESADSKASLTAASPLDDNSESPKKLNPCLGRSQSLDSAEESKRSNLRSESRRGFFSKFRSAKETKGLSKRGSSGVDSFNEKETSDREERPAFHSALHGQASSNKKLEPRAVAIPYSRIKKDRFYDWPPDPTVSRATPIVLFHETMEDIDSLTASVPDVPIPEDRDDEFPSTLRRRHVPEAPIPANITF